MDEKAAAHVLGGQANLWSEFVPNPKHAQYMTMPRLAALAEAVWTPKAKKNWDNFAQRMTTQMLRYDALGINYAKSAFLVSFETEFKEANKKLRLTMKTEMPGVNIHYTMD